MKSEMAADVSVVRFGTLWSLVFASEATFQHVLLRRFIRSFYFFFFFINDLKTANVLIHLRGKVKL